MKAIGMQLLGKQGMSLVVVAAAGLLMVGNVDIPPQACFLVGLLSGVSMLFLFRTNESSAATTTKTVQRQETSQPDQAATDASSTLYVGNIAYQSKETDLSELFRRHGSVKSVRILIDRGTNRSRGFGFIEMDVKGANAAISELDGFEFNGRNLRVTSANDRH